MEIAYKRVLLAGIKLSPSVEGVAERTGWTKKYIYFFGYNQCQEKANGNSEQAQQFAGDKEFARRNIQISLQIL